MNTAAKHATPTLTTLATVLFSTLLFAGLVSRADAASWESWQVPAVAQASSWCCMVWEQGSKARASDCNLDAPHTGFSSDREHVSGHEQSVRIYVKRDQGKAVDVRVYGSACPVRTQAELIDLGPRSGADSVRSLDALRTLGTLKRERIMAAIGAHSDPSALQQLSLDSRSPDAQTRRDALFWIAQLQGERGRDVILAALAVERSADVRKHAVFALSQLPGELATQTLIALLEQRTQPRDVRAEALFWLSQQESAAAQTYLASVLDPQ